MEEMMENQNVETGEPHSIDELANIEAEKAILGAIMLKNEVLDTIAGELAPEDFYREQHRQLYQAYLTLRQNQIPIDLTTTTEELRKEKNFDRLGGLPFLTQIAIGVPTAANVHYHAKIVKDYSKRRKFLDLAAQIHDAAYDLERTPEEILETLGKQFGVFLTPKAEGTKNELPVQTEEPAKEPTAEKEGDEMARPIQEHYNDRPFVSNEQSFEDMLKELKNAKQHQGKLFAMPYLEKIFSIVEDTVLQRMQIEKYQMVCKTCQLWTQILQETCKEFDLPEHEEVQKLQKESQDLEQKVKLEVDEWKKLYATMDAINSFSKNLLKEVDLQIQLNPLLKNPSVYTAKPFGTLMQEKKKTAKDIYFSALREAAITEHAQGIYEADQGVLKLLKEQKLVPQQQAVILSFSPRFQKFHYRQRGTEAKKWIQTETSKEEQK